MDVVFYTVKNQVSFIKKILQHLRKWPRHTDLYFALRLYFAFLRGGQLVVLDVFYTKNTNWQPCKIVPNCIEIILLRFAYTLGVYFLIVYISYVIMLYL